MTSKNEPLSFEQAIQELEQIVNDMERGSLTLDESIEAFSRGTDLLKVCRKKLDAAQKLVNKIQSERTPATTEQTSTQAGDDENLPF